VSFQQVLPLVLAATRGKRAHEFGVRGLVFDTSDDVVVIGGLWVLAELLLIVYCFRGESFELIRDLCHGFVRWMASVLRVKRRMDSEVS